MSDVKCQHNDNEPPCAKKIKTDEENGKSVTEQLLHLKDFTLNKVLQNNTNRKTICVLGNFKDKSGEALILLEKNAFKEDELNDGYFSADTDLRTFFQNDIYGNFECFPKASLNGK